MVDDFPTTFATYRRRSTPKLLRANVEGKRCAPASREHHPRSQWENIAVRCQDLLADPPLIRAGETFRAPIQEW